MKDFDDPAKVPKYWIPAQNKINLNKEIIFFKTHNAMCKINENQFTNKLNTLASIYIVRDPRNVITSLSNHYELSTKEAYEFLTNKRKIIFSKNITQDGKSYEERGNVHFIGSWEDHYMSWKKINFAPVKIIRYEELTSNTSGTFLSLLKFLKNFMSIKIDEKKMKKTIKACSFDVLKKKEKEEGFYEAPISEKNNKRVIFFNLGMKNNWKKYLDSKIENKIKLKFSAEMKELDYL